MSLFRCHILFQGLICACLFAFVARSHAADVKLTINNAPAQPGDMKPADVQALVIDNGLLNITFGKDAVGDFSATSVIKDGKELAHNLHGVEPRDVDRYRTFYLDTNAGRGHLECDTVRVLKNTPALAHFAVIDTHNPTKLEHHFIMMKDQSGVYGYVIIRTSGGGGGGGETRTMYRFDRDILDYAWTAERVGQQWKYADLQKLETLQDETWQLPDGTAYQKYDYCAYYSESPMWGHYGHGFGVFFIPASTESYAGGPLRQELIVHQDALILNYLGGGHFGGGGPAPGRTGEKIHGPWFLYFNTGQTPEEIIADAKIRAAEERAKWPYKWVEEKVYPLDRTTVTGQLKVADGRSPAGAWVVLAQPGRDVYNQGGDYIFYTKADDAGKFSLPNVRPGTYALHAWANQGSITHELIKEGVEVKDKVIDLGEVTWTPPHHNNLLWQIGKSDRMAGEFKFGDQLRNVEWISKVPENLTYTIGKSKPSDDWYFAHGKVGNWDVNFELNKTYTGDAYLTVPIAGGGGGASVTISVNGQTIKFSENGRETGAIAPGNDASTYRAAVRSGVYHLMESRFPASLLKQGQNTIRFNMTSNGGRWHGLMYDTVILEAD